MHEPNDPSTRGATPPVEITWKLSYAERQSVRRIYLALEEEAASPAIFGSPLASVWDEISRRVMREFAAMSPEGDLMAPA